MDFEGFDMWSDKYLVPYIEVYVSLLLYEAGKLFPQCFATNKKQINQS